MVCLPAVSFTEVPPVHQLELVGGRTHHRSNSVCVRSFTTHCQMPVLVRVHVLCVPNVTRHTPASGHTFYPATAAQGSPRWSQSVQHPEPPNLGGGRLWGW